MSDLEKIFSEYKLESNESASGHTPVTFWMPVETKVKYDKIQKFTNKQFCKKLKEIMIVAIERTAKDMEE